MMKDNAVPFQNRQKTEDFLSRIFTSIKKYAKKCRDSYYGMLSL